MISALRGILCEGVGGSELELLPAIHLRAPVVFTTTTLPLQQLTIRCNYLISTNVRFSTNFELIEHTYVMDVEHQDGTCCGEENLIHPRNIRGKLNVKTTCQNRLMSKVD